MSTTIDNQISELKAALPVLEEKAKLGVIHFDSHEKAKSLIRWHEAGRTLSDKQILFVGRLLQRAKRKHKKVDFTAVAAKPVDTDAIVAQVVEQIGDQRVDVDTVIESIMPRVIDHIERRAPRKVEIEIKQINGKKTKVKGPRHRNFDKLLKAATSRLQNGYVPGIFLKGEMSSGKSTAGEQLAEALNLKFYFNGAISFPHEMLGFIDGGGKYHRTPFRDAYEFGGVYVFDEVDRSDPVALLAVNPHLAGYIATFPDKQIKRHPDCIIIATANTWGLGGDANYSGATKLDGAFLSRFPGKINWDIDTDLENVIVEHPEWLKRVRSARAKAQACGLKVNIDVRIALAGVAYLKNGFSMDEAAEMTYLANVKPDQRTQIEG